MNIQFFFSFSLQVLTCWAGIPLTYVFSFFFSNSLAAFSVLVLIFFFVSLVSYSSLNVRDLIGRGNISMWHLVLLCVTLSVYFPPVMVCCCCCCCCFQLLLTTVFLVQVFGGDNGEDNANILHYIFLATPTYGQVIDSYSYKSLNFAL